MTLRAILLAAALVMTGKVDAADPVVPPKAGAETIRVDKEADTDMAAERRPSADEGVRDGRNGAPAGKAGTESVRSDDFSPTEKISEDFAVSFPVDI